MMSECGVGDVRKKGPLRTVWVAAHFNLLRKHDIHAINVAAFADSLMSPNVSIPFRFIAHLLLGLTRIHSLKVSYLYEDCNKAVTNLKKLLHSKCAEPSLENNARMQRSIAWLDIKIIEDIELDHCVIESVSCKSSHIGKYEDIIINGPCKLQFNQYEHKLGGEDDQKFNSNLHYQVQTEKSTVTYMEEDVLPALPLDEREFENFISTHSVDDASVCTAPLGMNCNQTFHKNYGSTMFDGTFRILDGQMVEPISPEYRTTTEKKLCFEEDILDIKKSYSGKRSINPECLSVQVSENAKRSSDIFQNADEPNSTSFQSDKDVSPPFQPTPMPLTPVLHENKQRSRKRKLVDEETYLSNKVTRQYWAETDDIIRTRRTASEASKFPDRVDFLESRKTMLYKPSFPGMCSSLGELFNNVYLDEKIQGVFKKLHPHQSEESSMSLSFEIPTNDDSVTNRFNNREEFSDTKYTANNETSQHQFIPSNCKSIMIENQFAKMDMGKEKGKSQETSVSENDNRIELSKENQDSSSENNFPCQEHSVSGSHSEQNTEVLDFTSLSWRTRAVARFLKADFQHLCIQQESSSLNLDCILRRKTMKEAARVFFEVLVLKSMDYLEVEQREAYASIYLSANPKLYKTSFES